MGIVSFLKSWASGAFARPAIPSGEHAERISFLEAVQGFAGAYADVNPGYPIAFIELFKRLAIVNPDVSQAVSKIVSLGNVGHNLEVSGTDRAAEGALDELNALARTAFPNNAGMDGFINQQLRQIAITGALVQETVPDMGFSGVEEVYQVRASSIRFRVEDKRFIPVQRAGTREIVLNPETFSYIPLFTDEDSPYAIPPMLASLRMLLRQERQWGSIDAFMDLWGLLGITWMKVNRRPIFGRAPNEELKDADAELTRYYNLFTKHMKKGIAVTGTNVELDHHNVSKNAGQIDALIQATEQQIASGMDIDPAMLGRTYSTTETYATVCYETLLGKIANIQRIVKRANEHTYNLHLTLRRIPATCSMKFRPAPSLKRKDEIETKKIDQDMVYQRMDKGTIDEDTAARELGYDEAYRKDDRHGADGSFSRIEFEYNRGTGRYEFSRPVISISREALAKKKSPMTRG